MVDDVTTPTGAKRSRGFASMDKDEQRKIASLGGKAVPNDKRSFYQNPELAAAAGRKGGKSVNPGNRSYSKDRALAVEAGRKGGLASQRVKRETKMEGDIS